VRPLSRPRSRLRHRRKKKAREPLLLLPHALACDRKKKRLNSGVLSERGRECSESHYEGHMGPLISFQKATVVSPNDFFHGHNSHLTRDERDRIR
jgi:hypothetical protein